MPGTPLGVPPVKLPRLRVSQLIYLVVYAALIGSALLHILFDPVVTYPSSIPGFVWAKESRVDETVVPRLVVEMDGQGAEIGPVTILGVSVVAVSGSGLPNELTDAAGLVDALCKSPGTYDGTWVLVPEGAVK